MNALPVQADGEIGIGGHAGETKLVEQKANLGRWP
jgi:hypothetical protein